MKPYVLTAKQSKNADESVKAIYALTDRAMIEVAGRTVALYCISEKVVTSSSTVLVCIGSGHNGCDGLVLARHLFLLGCRVDILICSDSEFSHDMRELIDINARLGIVIFYPPQILESAVFLNSYDTIFDAITGTGYSGIPRELQANIVQRINAYRHSGNAKVVALDVPSLHDPDMCSGEVSSAGIVADTTIALQTLKQIHVHPRSMHVVGEVELLDIGLPHIPIESSIELYTAGRAEEELSSLFYDIPRLHKGNKSKVIAFGGNQGKEGAAYLSAFASLKAGASLATVFSRSPLRFSVQIPEIMYLQHQENTIFDYESAIRNASSVVVGPGLGTDEIALAIFKKVVEFAHSLEKFLVIDADALPLYASLKKGGVLFPKNTVLTPHPKEFLSLLREEEIKVKDIEELEKKRHFFTEMFCQRNDVFLVLKGPRTLICNKNYCYINPHATSALAVGGSGDVLSGIIAAIGCRGEHVLNSIALSVFLHGACGMSLKDKNRHPYGNLASEIAEELPLVIQELSSHKKMLRYHVGLL